MVEEIDMSAILENRSSTFWKNGRLQTFEHWPFKSAKHLCTPENMANAGFYAIGGKDEPDLAECFMCCKQLDGWELDDDPWQEHKKHQPNCLFINLNKPDEKTLTVKELFQLMLNYYKHKKTVETEKVIEEAKKNWKDSAETIPNILAAIKKSKKSL